MNKITRFVEEVFSPFFAKMGSNRIITGLKNGMVTTVPFTIIGSMFIIIQQFPVDSWKEIIAPYSAMLNVPNMMTIGIISIYISFAVAYNMGKSHDIDGLSAGLLSLMGFMLLQIDHSTYSMSTAHFGARGIFPAIIIAIFVVKTMEFFINNNLVIKFPDGVPPAVSKAFASLYPGIFVTLVLFTLSSVLKIDILGIIIQIFSPLVFALNTLPGILVFMLFAQLLWASGIHGMAVMNAVGSPVFLSYIAANAEAAMTGAPIPYITATGFITFFVSIGGTGATLGLILSMLRSKEKSFNMLGKLALPPGLFNINEPITFGFPIVLNPIMMIPFIIVPLINATLSYLLMYFNIIGRPIAQVPWIMPGPIGAYLTTGGDILAAVWFIALTILSAVLYYPFFRIAEKQRLNSQTSE